MTSLPEDNANFLLGKLRSCEGLEENKKLVLDFYHERLASGLKLSSMVNYLKVLVRLMDFANKPLKQISKQELIDFFISIRPVGVSLPTNS